MGFTSYNIINQVNKGDFDEESIDVRQIGRITTNKPFNIYKSYDY